MRFLRKLIPAFLWQWDQRLLQDMPRLWATRVHLHIWFLLLCNALALLLGLLIKVNHRKFPDPEELFAYMIVPTIAYAAFWVYRAVRFNAEKRFGARRTYNEVGEFVVLWISALLIMSIPTTLALTVGLRIAALTPDEEFADEVNLLSSQQEWFYGITTYYDEYEYSEEEYENQQYAVTEAEAAASGGADQEDRVPQGSGSHAFFRSIAEYRERNDVEARMLNAEVPALDDVYGGYVRRANRAQHRRDTANFNPDTAAHYNAKADSIERGFPLLLIDHSRFRPWSERLTLKSDSVLEAEYLDRFERGAPMDHAAIERALAIASKYSWHVKRIGAEQVAAEFRSRLRSTASIDACRDQLARISKAKDLRYFFMAEAGYFYFIAIFSFCLVLLLTAFKRIYWQPFLIAIVTAGVMPILVLILALITEHDVIPLNDDEIMVYAHWFIAVFLFAMLFTIPQQRAYRTNRAVMALLANVVVPFFAIFTLMILHEEHDIFGQDALNAQINRIQEQNEHDPALTQLRVEAHALRELIESVMLWTFWCGIALYVLVLHPLFARLYARLMALPERS
jgi:hypothetical protein